MGKLLGESKKDIVTGGSNSISDYRPGYQLEVKKKLSPLAYGIIGSLYTIAVIVTTVRFVKDDKPMRGFSYSEQKIKEEVLDEVRKMAVGSSEVKIDAKLNNHLEKFRTELIGEINRINIKYVEMIETNDAYKDKVVSDIVDRTPASQKIKEGKAIPYNDANRKLISFKHRKEYQRAKEDFEIKKSEYMKSLNLASTTDQRKLQDFQDQIELSLYELKQNQKMVEEEFKKNQFLVINQ